MSSRQEIKDAFSAELKNTPQYQIVLDVKQAILAEIAAPNVQPYFFHQINTALTREEREIIKLCMILEFGFYTDNITETNCIIIDMKQFLGP
jgi:hypothetical protein